MFCLWPVNKRHDLKTKIVPESPRYTFSCSHDLSIISPNPLHSLIQSLHLSFLSHGMRAQKLQGSGGQHGLSEFPQPTNSMPQFYPVCPSGATTTPTTTSALASLYSHFSSCEGHLLFYYSSRSYASGGGNWRHYNQLDKGFTSSSMTFQMGDIK